MCSRSSFLELTWLLFLLLCHPWFRRVLLSEIWAFCCLLFEYFHVHFNESTLRSKFEAITNEIKEYLQKSPLIIVNGAKYVWFALIELQEKSDLLLLGLVRHDVEGFDDDVVHVEIVIFQMKCWFFQFCKVEQIIHHICDHICRIYRVLDIKVHLSSKLIKLVATFEVSLTYFHTSLATLAELRSGVVLDVINLWLFQMLHLFWWNWFDLLNLRWQSVIFIIITLLLYLITIFEKFRAWVDSQNVF